MYRIKKKGWLLHQTIYNHLLSNFNKPSSSYYKAYECNTSVQNILSGRGSFEVKHEGQMRLTRLNQVSLLRSKDCSEALRSPCIAKLLKGNKLFSSLKTRLTSKLMIYKVPLPVLEKHCGDRIQMK